jgi:hypothetical protein
MAFLCVALVARERRSVRIQAEGETSGAEAAKRSDLDAAESPPRLAYRQSALGTDPPNGSKRGCQMSLYIVCPISREDGTGRFLDIMTRGTSERQVAISPTRSADKQTLVSLGIDPLDCEYLEPSMSFEDWRYDLVRGGL